MTLQEFYTRIGGNYDDTLRRIPSEALVRKFVLKYPNDPSFGQLKDALAAQDWETAFRAAHTLKGVSRDLGFTPLFEAAAALSDALRLDDAGVPANMEAVPELMPAVRDAYATVVDAIAII